MRVRLVGGASAFIIFNGIATTLCIASCVVSLRTTIICLFMTSLQGFDGHENLVYLYVYDRVRVDVDQYFHDATDRYCTIYPPSFLMSLMLESIAASIFVTLSGPPEFCDTKAAISVCASFTILVPISWLASTLCAYNFLLLCPDVSSKYNLRT